jgi:hypothetical protein
MLIFPIPRLQRCRLILQLQEYYLEIKHRLGIRMTMIDPWNGILGMRRFEMEQGHRVCMLMIQVTLFAI